MREQGAHSEAASRQARSRRVTPDSPLPADGCLLMTKWILSRARWWLYLALSAALLMYARPPHAYAQGDVYYVAPYGDDNNPGTLEAPFRTLTRARYAVHPGDTIYLRAGVYDIENEMDISGTPDAPITIASYPGEWAVFDGSGAPDGVKFRVTGSWLIFRHFEVRNGPSDGVLITEGAGHNVFEHIVSHHNHFAGFELEYGAHDNVLRNCDAYANFDADTYGEHADGFGVKFGVGPGNRLVHCRAWNNADDGFDLWEAGASVRLEGCWAYGNGFDRWGVGANFAGDGNGFKLGPGGPVVTHCVAWDNARRGFDFNDAAEPEMLYNNTSYRNPVGFNFHGAAHVLRNNLSFADGALSLGPEVDDRFNSWNLPLTAGRATRGVRITAADFLSLDDASARGPRQPDGALPFTLFLHLRPTSDLVDAGVDIGEPWLGAAPDLGAFEGYLPPFPPGPRR